MKIMVLMMVHCIYCVPLCIIARTMSTTEHSFFSRFIQKLTFRPQAPKVDHIEPGGAAPPGRASSEFIRELELLSRTPTAKYEPNRYRDVEDETLLTEIRREFAWASDYVIDPHGVHLLDVLALLREIEHIGGSKLINCLHFLRIATVSETQGKYDQTSEMGMRLNFHYHLKSGDDADAFKSVLDDLKDRVFRQSFIIRPKVSKVIQAQESNQLPGLALMAPSHTPVGPVAAVLPDNAAEVIKTLADQSEVSEAKKLKAFAKKIEKAQIVKPLALIKNETLANLQADRFPNFEELITYLKGQSALAAIGDGVFRLPPILLIGEPGIGKTAFLLRLAKVIKTDFLSINMASAQTGSAISGSDIHWSNSRQGQLFNKLVFGETANPIVFLDEVDKIGADSRYDPAGALYPLLERKTAAKFEDLSLPGLFINASHVVWIAAANKKDVIEPALLSRFRVFHIPEPTKIQMPAIVESVYSDLRDGEVWGAKFSNLSDDVLHAVAAAPPRDVRKMLEGAMAVAAIDRRRHLRVDDLVPLKGKPSIGF